MKFVYHGSSILIVPANTATTIFVKTDKDEEVIRVLPAETTFTYYERGKTWTICGYHTDPIRELDLKTHRLFMAKYGKEGDYFHHTGDEENVITYFKNQWLIIPTWVKFIAANQDGSIHGFKYNPTPTTNICTGEIEWGPDGLFLGYLGYWGKQPLNEQLTIESFERVEEVKTIAYFIPGYIRKTATSELTEALKIIQRLQLSDKPQDVAVLAQIKELLK